MCAVGHFQRGNVCSVWHAGRVESMPDAVSGKQRDRHVVKGAKLHRRGGLTKWRLYRLRAGVLQ